MSKLDEAFNILPANDVLESTGVVVQPDENAEDKDFDYTRQNQIDLIEVSKAAVATAMRIASESEQPRAVETLAIMLKTASELNRQLVLQSKDKAETKAAKKNAAGSMPAGIQAGQVGSVTNNTIVMTGTMQEMLDQLKQLKNNAT